MIGCKTGNTSAVQPIACQGRSLINDLNRFISNFRWTAFSETHKKNVAFKPSESQVEETCLGKNKQKQNIRSQLRNRQMCTDLIPEASVDHEHVSSKTHNPLDKEGEKKLLWILLYM